jgi:SecD/SecF fusion protein
MVVCLYIFGVTSIKEFALPLLVGIVAGGYSSVCLAGGLWFVLRQKFEPKPEEEEEDEYPEVYEIPDFDEEEE